MARGQGAGTATATRTRADTPDPAALCRGRWQPSPDDDLIDALDGLQPGEHPEDVLAHFGVDYEYVSFETGQTLLAFWQEHKDENGDDRFLVSDWQDAYPSVEPVPSFIHSLSESAIAAFYPEQDFNADFWAGGEGAAALYHGTTAEHAAEILRDGLEARNETRGITNRFTGAAVFTSRERSYTEHYGEQTIEIDVAAMKADGFCPQVSLESPLAGEQLQSALAWKLGIEDW